MNSLIVKIVIASFAATGLIEYLKNFITTKKTWIFSVIMPFFAAGAFCATEYLPISVVGSILTVGAVQLNYQVIVQGFKKVINETVNKMDKIDDSKNTENKNFSQQ